MGEIMIGSPEGIFHLRIPVHLPELEALMADIDVVVQQVQTLTDAVRGFVQRQADALNTANQELANLKADDAVEDSKLEGLSSALTSLTDEVNNFGTQTEVPVDPSDPSGETEPIAPDAVVDNTLPGDLPQE